MNSLDRGIDDYLGEREIEGLSMYMTNGLLVNGEMGHPTDLWYL